MNEPFVKIDLHGMRKEEAMKAIDRAIASAGSETYQNQLIHGYHRGTNLRSMIYDWYRCYFLWNSPDRNPFFSS